MFLSWKQQVYPRKPVSFRTKDSGPQRSPPISQSKDIIFAGRLEQIVMAGGAEDKSGE